MVRVTLQRIGSDAQGTRGVLVTEDGVYCCTLELPWRENAPKKSCIPCGEYDVDVRQSPKFGLVYEVKGVPGRKYILMHSGNLAGDTEKGYISHVEGCILLGKYFGRIGQQRGVLYSRPMVTGFMALMEGKPFRLKVEDVCGS